MKKSIVIVGAAIVAALATVPLVVTGIRSTSTPTEAPADQRHERELSEKHRERIARRKARQAAYERFIDSTVLSHNFAYHRYKYLLPNRIYGQDYPAFQLRLP